MQIKQTSKPKSHTLPIILRQKLAFKISLLLWIGGIGGNGCYNLMESDISNYLKIIYEQMILKSQRDKNWRNKRKIFLRKNENWALPLVKEG